MSNELPTMRINARNALAKTRKAYEKINNVRPRNGSGNSAKLAIRIKTPIGWLHYHPDGTQPEWTHRANTPYMSLRPNQEINIYRSRAVKLSGNGKRFQISDVKINWVIRRGRPVTRVFNHVFSLHIPADENSRTGLEQMSRYECITERSPKRFRRHSVTADKSHGFYVPFTAFRRSAAEKILSIYKARITLAFSGNTQHQRSNVLLLEQAADSTKWTASYPNSRKGRTKNKQIPAALWLWISAHRHLPEVTPLNAAAYVTAPHWPGAWAHLREQLLSNALPETGPGIVTRSEVQNHFL